MSKQTHPFSLCVEVLSVSGELLRLEKVGSVRVLLDDGSSLGIRPGHAPLIAATRGGDLVYELETGPQSVPIPAGILNVKDNVVSILSTY